MRYVPKALLDEWESKDAIARYRARLIEMSVATDAELTEIERQSKSFAEAEADEALAAPMPEASSGSYGVYAGEEPPRRRVEIVRSPFHAEVAAVRAGAAAVSAA
jgi:TPP-dependent pyruvate/acetoin dehydrogenase alpha subunit